MKREPVGIEMAKIKQLQSRIITKMLKGHAELEDTGEKLNAGQLNLMHQLWKEDDIIISELGKRASLANTTLTAMLERLESKGLVKRVVKVSNRREIRVCLTDKAKLMRMGNEEVLSRMHSINFAGFTEAEEAQMYQFLERMKKNLEEYDCGNE